MGAVPPLVGVAVKVQLEPAHAGFVPVVRAILTDGTSELPIVIVIVLEETLKTVPQAEFTVSTQET